MVALLLIPMTMDVQSRPSFIFQGFCVGWFLEGVGRWGFDTPAETRERFVGAGLWNSARPSWENASLALWRNGSLSWTFPAEAGEVYTDLDSFDAQRGAGISGYSLLMNDFPVYSGPLASFALNGTANYFDMKAGNGTTPFFWRVAGVQSDGTVLDYSDVLQGFGNGTLRFPNGSWWDPD